MANIQTFEAAVAAVAAELSKRFVGTEGLKGIKEILDNKVNKDGTKGLSEKDFTAALETKLKSILDGAEPNKIDSITVDGEPVTIEGKVAKIDLTEVFADALEEYMKTVDADKKYQTKADMENYYSKTEADNKFVDQDELETKITQQVGKVYRPMGSKANYAAIQAITDAKEGDVWNDLTTGANYAYTAEGDWDKLSETVDLTPYLTKSEASGTYLTEADKSEIQNNAQGYADYVVKDMEGKINQNIGDIKTTANGASLLASQTSQALDAYKTEADEKFIDEDELAEAIEGMLTDDNLVEALQSVIDEVVGEFSKEETLAILNGTTEG